MICLWPLNNSSGELKTDGGIIAVISGSRISAAAAMDNCGHFDLIIG